MPKRTIVFGDIHACYEEWQTLMDKLKVTNADRLISVGDLVCKGPDTRKTLDLAMSLPNLECVMGNHEVHLLHFYHEPETDRIMKPHQERAFKELEKDLDKYMDFIGSFPHYIEGDDFIVIHGGLMPDIPIEKQQKHDLVFTRTVPPFNNPWHDYYKGEKVIVYGHWAMQGLHITENTIGLDSGCVYGKELSAVVLPEREIVAVPAKKVYSPID